MRRCVPVSIYAKRSPMPTLRSESVSQFAQVHFAGLSGIVLRNKSRLRVVITLSLIMQSMSVEVDSKDIEPVMSLLNPGRDLCCPISGRSDWGLSNAR